MRISFAFFLILTCLSTYSQEPSFKLYTVKDGLPGGTVYQCVQDEDGYIWFATNQGVSRFDGHSFKNFTKNEGLPDNEIIKIHKDSKNRLWFISMLGIPAVYYKGRIQSFPTCKDVTAFSEDERGNRIYLMFATLSTFGYYSSDNTRENWQFDVTSKHKYPIGNMYNWPILRHSGKAGTKIYFSNDDVNLICTVEDKGVSTTNVSLNKGYNIIPAFSAQSYFSFSNASRSLVYYTRDSLYHWKDGEYTAVFSFASIGLIIDKEHDISSVFYENENRLWLTTRHHGLICVTDFLKPTKKIDTFFPTNFCTSIMKDNEGGYWVTTHNEGVYYIPNLNFRSFSHKKLQIGRDVRAIKSINDETVIAGFADGNLLSINTRNYRSKTYAKWVLTNRNNRILDIQGYGNHFVVATDKGVFEIRKDESFKRLTKNHISSKSIYVDQHENVLIASATVIQVLKGDGKDSTLSQFRGTSTAGIGNTYYWGTLKGLYTFDGSQVIDLGKKYPELSGIIIHVDIAKDSAIWASTQDGLVVLKKGKTYKINKRHGLLSNSCKQVSFDDNRVAWLSTDQGLSRIAFQWENGELKFHISNITEADGLVSNDVNQTTISNNFLWVSTSEGISYFPLSFSSGSSVDPRIHINKILIGRSEIPVQDTIYIKPEDNLSLSLAGISYRSGKQVQYEYKLDKQDKIWNRLSTNNLEFTALPYGNFQLAIRAVDRWGQPSASPVLLTIINKPPFWKTDWFYTVIYSLAVLLIGGSAYSYFNYRQKKQEKEYSIKRKILELETMAFRAQINPHFIFNCLSSIQHHILKSDPFSANLYLHKLSVLIRKILQSSASPTILLSEEIAIIKVYLELQKLRLEERLDYAINISNDILVEDTPIPSMIIQPFVENAIKHGLSSEENKKGWIGIDVSRSDDKIICIIEDNGIGIRESKRMNQKTGYPSMGMNITERRIQAINSMHTDKVLLETIDKSDLDPLQEGTIIKLTFILSRQLW